MNKVLDIIEGLDQAEQDELLNTLMYRRAQSAVTFSRLDEAVWDAVVHACEVRTAPLAVFVKSYGKKKFKDAVQVLNLFIDTHCSTVIRWPRKVALIERLVKVLAKYLRKRDIPVTPTSLCNSMVLLVDATNAAFPGYADCRLLHRIAPEISPRI